MGVNTTALDAQQSDGILPNPGAPEMLPEPVIIQFHKDAF